MQFQSHKCDECGRVKGEANHWYRATRLPGPRFVIVPWDTPLFRVPDPAATEQHLCGEGCATKALLRAMSGDDELQTPVKPNFEEVNA
jgi:hypothetical protein